MSSRAIEVAIQKLAGVHKTDDLVCMACTVQSVNESAATCDCMGDNDILIPNVKLQAGVCDGLLLLPSVGSTVIIAVSKYNDPFVFMLSDVDKFYIQVGDNSSITVTNDGVQIFTNKTVDIAAGNNTISMDDSGVNIDPGSGSVFIGGNQQVLYANIPEATAIASLGEIGVSNKLKVG
jgi:hypothetical protein